MVKPKTSKLSEARDNFCNVSSAHTDGLVLLIEHKFQITFNGK